MSGCHDSEPAKIVIAHQLPEGKTIEFCIWCREDIPCGCALEMVRHVQDKLESHTKWAQRYVDDFNKRLIEINLHYWNLKVFVDEIVNINQNKRPHKCPVCEGFGKTERARKNGDCEGMPLTFDCIACEGKGIIIC